MFRCRWAKKSDGEGIRQLKWQGLWEGTEGWDPQYKTSPGLQAGLERKKRGWIQTKQVCRIGWWKDEIFTGSKSLKK